VPARLRWLFAGSRVKTTGVALGASRPSRASSDSATGRRTADRRVNGVRIDFQVMGNLFRKKSLLPS
jgi:hypothetical protein